ncbi:MAG: MBL fold metallo-hydrolase, partial [Mycobacterium sp.]
MTSLELTSSGTAEFGEGEVYFIGNATTLIRFGGLTILTDPAFLHKGEHVYLGHGIWARREVEPACQIAELPPIDLIVLSHYHGDHFDDVAAQELDKKLPIVSTADAVGKLSGLGFERGHPPRHLGIAGSAQKRSDAEDHRDAGPARHRRGSQRAPHARQRAPARLQSQQRSALSALYHRGHH